MIFYFILNMSDITINKITIKNKENLKLNHNILYFTWNDDSLNPRNIICSCQDYIKNDKCKHIETYDPINSDLWKTSKTHSQTNSSTFDIKKIIIKSETYCDIHYYIYYIFLKNNNKHIDTICTCPGFKWRGYCKHIDKYNVNKSDLWKNSKNI